MVAHVDCPVLAAIFAICRVVVPVSVPAASTLYRKAGLISWDVLVPR